MLVYGWSRWPKILSNLDQSKEEIQTEQDILFLAKILVAFCFLQYSTIDSTDYSMIEKLVYDLIGATSTGDGDANDKADEDAHNDFLRKYLFKTSYQNAQKPNTTKLIENKLND